MRKKSAFVLISAAMVFIFISLAICSQSSSRKEKDDLYRQVELFSDSLVVIQAEYVDQKKPKDLIYGALKGMLSSLDPHSQFLDPDSYKELKIDTEGKFGGIGIEITVRDGLLTVVTAIEDTPAWSAGLKPGDKIVKIDAAITRDMELSEAVKMLRGLPQTTVDITILRESEKKLLEFKIKRGIINIKDIKEALVLENGIAYLRLIEFREDTPAHLFDSLDRLSREGMKALILDLRNNPGGLLDAAVRAAGKFIPEGELICYTKGRDPADDLRFSAHSANPILDIPIVVLINEGSASGSEIVAAALQDHKRALIMGMKSFGKGSVQTVIPLSDGSALRLTTSRYFTPLGKVIHEKAVTPDIVVEEAVNIPREGLKEAAGDIFEKLEAKKSPSGKFSYDDDKQLLAAIGTLKAILIYEKR